MKYINKIRNFYIPFDYPKFALVISIAALAFAASSHNTPCISAQSTCSVGSDNEFSGNISLKGGTAYKSTFDASGITADRTLTIPNNTGTLALTSDIVPPSYTPDAPFLKVDGTGTAVVGTATVDAPFVSVDGSGQLDSSATLTASTPLKSSATGQIAASDLDITTDITPGTALQEIRVNSGGTALEYFTPTGGGDITKVADGNMVASSTYTGMVMACWYGQHTLDGTKKYMFIMDGDDYNIAQTGDDNYWRQQTGDCTSGGGSYFNNTMADAYSVTGNLNSTKNASGSTSYCNLLNGNTANYSSQKTSNIAGTINFQPWRVDISGGWYYGINSYWELSGVTYNSINNPAGIQMGEGSCIAYTTDSFTTITGFDFMLEANANTDRRWALYEINY